MAIILRYAPKLEEKMAGDLGESDLEFLKALVKEDPERKPSASYGAGKEGHMFTSSTLAILLEAYQNIDNAFIHFQSASSGESRSDRLSSLLIRLGLAFVFLYAAVFMTFAPEKYIVYFPDFMRELVPGYTLLHVFAAFEVILSVFLIIGKFTFVTAIISFLTMLALTVVNLDMFSVLFRNVSIILSALALAIQTRKSK
jgi:uncharacterized membrane protein YphA (DoxX/SURF4 family)